MRRNGGHDNLRIHDALQHGRCKSFQRTPPTHIQFACAAAMSLFSTSGRRCKSRSAKKEARKREHKTCKASSTRHVRPAALRNTTPGECTPNRLRNELATNHRQSYHGQGQCSCVASPSAAITSCMVTRRSPVADVGPIICFAHEPHGLVGVHQSQMKYKRGCGAGSS